MCIIVLVCVITLLITSHMSNQDISQISPEEGSSEQVEHIKVRSEKMPHLVSSTNK